MSSIMTKRGNQDNIITYEYICDTTADLATLKPVMGSVAIIIHGDTGFEIYMADGNKQWVSLDGASNNDEANSPQVDLGQADSMILGE